MPPRELRPLVDSQYVILTVNIAEDPHRLNFDLETTNFANIILGHTCTVFAHMSQ